jgi:hypothetical protein
VKDDELLTDYISRCRMVFHFDTCKELAGDAVEEAKKAAEEKEKARLEAVRWLVEKERVPEKGLVGSLKVDEELYGNKGFEDGYAEEVLTQEHLDAIAEAEGDVEGMDVDE